MKRKLIKFALICLASGLALDDSGSGQNIHMLRSILVWLGFSVGFGVFTWIVYTSPNPQVLYLVAFPIWLLCGLIGAVIGLQIRTRKGRDFFYK